METKIFLTAILAFLFTCYTFSQSLQECATQDNTEWFTSLKRRTAANEQTERQLSIIPYQIHFFRASDGSSNLTLSEIYQEIDSVNDFYSSSNMVFVECLAPQIVDDSYYHTFDHDLHHADVLTQFYTQGIVNMYFYGSVSYNSTPVCGYSQYPPSEDYVMMSGNCATNGSTLAHELGHLFGLPHTHGGTPDELADGSNCATEGDYICDTPADPTLGSSVVDTNCVYTGTATDANGMFYAPDPSNIMSYSRKKCRNYFSPMQYDVINYTYLNERYYLTCSVTSDELNNNIEKGFSLAPNPSHDFVNIRLNNIANNTQFCIMDINGKINEVVNLNKNSTIISISDWPSGMYFYLLTNDSGLRIRGKYIKQ
jgi:hypothetical protein